ncbi:copper resistance protein CopC [Bacillus sp. V3B]|uniref:copper resistance CopC/CopD family protein n=1 Tax=Bacillus sp. V3B TaxID=2804915 RepID=UPI002108D0A2|nr:copper resistance protein CopC [Bacillus sp. V3B]MCQ6276631.1 copper resistance protein CopC [Bacillus sp. V3B]
MIKYLLRNILILCSLIFILTVPQGVFAHALLENATPAPDSQLKSSPKEIVLMFNERLERELYSIKVFNEHGDMVSNSKTEMSKDQKYIRQSLPILPNGNYAISYSVLSSDGHPIKGSYVVSIGEETVLKRDLNQLILHEDNGSVLFNAFSSIIRILYYIALILTTGWIVWGTINKMEQGEMRADFRQRAFYLQITLFITTVGMGLLQFAVLLDQWTLAEIWSILTGTTTGISLALSVLLSILGFAILFRFKWLNLLWVFMILVAKSVNGHAMAFEPPIRTISLDIIHLLAVAIWAGGLLYILVYWKKEKEHVRQFLSTFSKVALISILVLIVTGVSSTLIFLPEVHYLFYTQWGKMLLVKVTLVLFVIVIGGILRYMMKKKRENSIGNLLKIDFSLMIVILGIVGVFTHLNPLPQNEPLEWHERDNYIEFTTSILPKVPGNNHFMVIANSHKEGIEIKRIELFLKYKDNPDVAPIQVPFTQLEQSNNVQYMIDGKYLPFAGNWTAEVQILDSEDNENVFSREFIVY